MKGAIIPYFRNIIAPTQRIANISAIGRRFQLAFMKP